MVKQLVTSQNDPYRTDYPSNFCFRFKFQNSVCFFDPQVKYYSLNKKRSSISDLEYE